MKLLRLITRRRVKWTGLVATICLAAAMVASYWYWPRYTWVSALSSNTWRVQVVPGGLELVHTGSQSSLGLYDFIERWEEDLPAMHGPAVANPDPFIWLPKYNSQTSMSSVMRIVTIPLWIPLVLCALPTAWLFRPDRKPKAGQCPKCRYDLRGLDGGICPECGTPTGREA